MVTRRKFLRGAMLGGGTSGVLGAWVASRAAARSERPSSLGADRLLEGILSYPIDDTHCHPVTEHDAETTVPEFLARISLLGFAANGYFPEGVFVEWQQGDPETRARLDREHGILEVVQAISRHFAETIFVKSMVKEMASFLGCEASLPAVVEARNHRGKEYGKYIHDLFQDVRIEHAMIDTGFMEGMDASGLDRFENTIHPAKVRCVARVETIQGPLLREDLPFEDLEGRFTTQVREALDGTGNFGRRSYGMKSYILPTLGLVKPCYDRTAAARSWEELKKSRDLAEGDREVAAGRGRELKEYLLTLALEECLSRDMPMQFHAGDGEAPYVILRNQHPFLLEEMVRFDKNGVMRAPKIVPIHAGYPLVDEAMWLSHVYPNCYFEISAMNPFAHQGLYHRYLQVMEGVPLSKILFASDAFHIPELYWLAGRWGRRFLADALAVYLEEKMLTEEEALDAAQRILHRNNRELYHLT